VQRKALKVRGCSDDFQSHVGFLARRFGNRDLGAERRLDRGCWQRQEGRGVGDGVRLRGRNKALEGEPHERIRHEIRPASSERKKAPRG
jgi:hypothetical protein